MFLVINSEEKSCAKYTQAMPIRDPTVTPGHMLQTKPCPVPQGNMFAPFPGNLFTREWRKWKCIL